MIDREYKTITVEAMEALLHNFDDAKVMAPYLVSYINSVAETAKENDWGSQAYGRMLFADLRSKFDLKFPTVARILNALGIEELTR